MAKKLEDVYLPMRDNPKPKRPMPTMPGMEGDPPLSTYSEEEAEAIRTSCPPAQRNGQTGLDVFVTVGTTSFPALVEAMFAQETLAALEAAGVTRVTLQHGRGGGVSGPASVAGAGRAADGSAAPGGGQRGGSGDAGDYAGAGSGRRRVGPTGGERKAQRGKGEKNSTTSSTPALGECRISVEQHELLPSTAPWVERADLVVCHAGAGSILDALRAGKRAVVVVNSDLMGNHQVELAEAMAQAGHVLLASPETLGSVLLEALLPTAAAAADDAATNSRQVSSSLRSRGENHSSALPSTSANSALSQSPAPAPPAQASHLTRRAAARSNRQALADGNNRDGDDDSRFSADQQRHPATTTTSSNKRWTPTPLPPPAPAALATRIAAHTAPPSAPPNLDYEYGPLAYQRQDFPQPLEQKLKVAFFWITLIAPIRLFIFAFFFLGNWIWGALALAGLKKDDQYITKPLPAWRRAIIKYGTMFFTTMAMLTAGMIPGLTWTKSKVTRDMLPKTGAPANKAEVDKWGGEGKAPILVSTHTSWVDAVTLVATNGCPSPVTAIETYNLPFIHLPLRAMQSLPTNRQGDGSSNVVEMINERVKGEGASRMPPIMVFPEGGTNNGTVLTQFRTGGFRAGVPIRVLAMNYPWKYMDPAWEAMHLGEHIVYFFGQVFNRFHYTEFPVYYPSEAEKKNPALFASNVREWMRVGLRLGLEEINIRDKWAFLSYLLKKKTFAEYKEARMHNGEAMSPPVTPLQTPRDERESAKSK